MARFLFSRSFIVFFGMAFFDLIFWGFGSFASQPLGLAPPSPPMYQTSTTPVRSVAMPTYPSGPFVGYALSYSVYAPFKATFVQTNADITSSSALSFSNTALMQSLMLGYRRGPIRLYGEFKPMTYLERTVAVTTIYTSSTSNDISTKTYREHYGYATYNFIIDYLLFIDKIQYVNFGLVVGRESFKILDHYDMSTDFIPIAHYGIQMGYNIDWKQFTFMGQLRYVFTAPYDYGYEDTALDISSLYTIKSSYIALSLGVQYTF